MGTFDRLAVGDEFHCPPRTVPADTARLVVDVGGYTHPLFHDDAQARAAGFAGVPVPGQFVLFLLGGMAERSGRFDETTVALVGLDRVRFSRPAFPGDELRLTCSVLAKEAGASGRTGTVRLAWRCDNGAGDTVLNAEATFLFRL
jgi:acyl dehydratase